MKIVLYVILGLGILAGFFLLYKDYIKRKMLKMFSRKITILEPLIEKLRDNKAIDEDEILMMCEDPSLRLAVFRILQTYDKMILFPQVYLTCEKGAESFLVNWLEFPTELGTTPDRIEFLIKIILHSNDALQYYAYKFIVNSSHWGSGGWILGICGPYHNSSLPYEIPFRIFSRFNPIQSISAQEEAQWVHDNINKGL